MNDDKLFLTVKFIVAVGLFTCISLIVRGYDETMLVKVATAKDWIENLLIGLIITVCLTLVIKLTKVKI